MHVRHSRVRCWALHTARDLCAPTSAPHDSRSTFPQVALQGSFLTRTHRPSCAICHVKLKPKGGRSSFQSSRHILYVPFLIHAV